MTTYDSFLAILGIVLIPVIIWWWKVPNPRNIKLLGFFIIAFWGSGSLELTELNVTLVRYAFELPILGLFIWSVIQHGIKRLPGSIPLLIFIFATTLSMAFTNPTLYILFLLMYLNIWFAFYYFYTLPNGYKSYDTINRLFVALCVSQFIASIIKFFIVGICEPYIGSMSSHAGGVTTYFSLIGFTMALIYYFFTKSKKAIWMMVGFIIFGLIGEKRALVFMMPVSYFICLFVYSMYTKQYNNFFRKTMWGILLMPILFYVMCRVHPSFNPEREVWGEFDLEYILDYTDRYSTGEMWQEQDEGAGNIGRSKAVAYFHNQIFNDDWQHILLGYGSGTLIQSGFNNIIGGDIQDYSIRRWGIGYSMGIGYLTLLAQVGIVGVVSYFLIYICLIRFLYRKAVLYRSRLNTKEQCYILASIVGLLSGVILTLAYDKTAIELFPPCIMMMWVTAYSLRIIAAKANHS